MMVEDNIDNLLQNSGMPVPNVWIELEGEFLEFDKENETLKCKFPVRERYFNPLPTTLGGIIDSWIDITMGPLSVLLGQKAVTKTFSIKFIKPVGPSIKYVTAVAWRESINGRSSQFKGELYLDNGELAAIAESELVEIK
jgi:acyl-coenzyme A thioesterase PaaI-like protein|tara:strand:- start:292 stop:711 length:420 start_codon:yes stop_codon:yes gene_type:complete